MMPLPFLRNSQSWSEPVSGAVRVITHLQTLADANFKGGDYLSWELGHTYRSEHPTAT